MHHVSLSALRREFNNIIGAPIYTMHICLVHFPSGNTLDLRYSLHTTVKMCKQYGIKKGTHYEAVPQQTCLRMICREWNWRRHDQPDEVSR